MWSGPRRYRLLGPDLFCLHRWSSARPNGAAGGVPALDGGGKTGGERRRQLHGGRSGAVIRVKSPESSARSVTKALGRWRTAWMPPGHPESTKALNSCEYNKFVLQGTKVPIGGLARQGEWAKEKRRGFTLLVPTRLRACRNRTTYPPWDCALPARLSRLSNSESSSASPMGE